MPQTPIVEVDNVSYEAGGLRILDQVSWSIRSGERWAMLGPNGAGKTTLLKVACGYLWPNAGGRVLRLGRQFADLRVLRRSIGWVTCSLAGKIPPSEPALDTVVSGKFAQTGLLKMAWDPPCREDYAKAELLLDQMRCPDVAGKPFGVLSQGEQQKVLIARARMTDPMLVILDEPCAGLDPGSRERLLADLEHLASASAATSLVLVTHHLEEITPSFDRLLVLGGGQVVGCGNTPELVNEKMLDKLYGAPVSRIVESQRRFWPIW